MKKNQIFRSFLLPLYFSCIVFSAGAQSGINPAYAESMQQALDSLREVKDVKGISAAVYIPGAGTWTGVTGVSHVTLPIDTDMLFDIGSTTKTFVAAEVMKLIDEGYFGLDDAISTLLPPIENVTPEITVRQLLQHKSGLADYLNAEWQTAMFDDLERIWYSPQAMDSFLTAPTGLPGGTWNYRNTNYVLLGMIAEHFRGDSLHKILRNDFLTPLNLHNTYMEMFEDYDNDIADNWSTPTFDPDLAVNVSFYPHEAMYTSTSFAGGFFSSAADIATWGYNLYSGKVISDTSMANMLNFTAVSGGYFNGYGLGCMRYIQDGKIYYGHAGNFFGYAACMIYDPVDSICLALLVNQDCLSPYIGLSLIQEAIENLSMATGIAKHPEEKKIKVFPNPVGDVLHVVFPVSGQIDITLTDMTGHVVYGAKAIGDMWLIETASLPDGMYILKGIAGKYRYIQKVVVKN